MKMDVIDLWEILSNVDGWSFETFPWDVFSLCHSSVEQDPNSPSKSIDDADSTNPKTLQDDTSEIVSSNHVPPEEVPTHQVVQSLHSNQNDHSENNDDYHTDLINNTGLISSEENIITNDIDHDQTNNLDTLQIQTLEESMTSLKESLDNRSTLSTFEKLSKKKLDADMEIAKSAENVPKNRYKDVLPYDESRVVLSGKLEDSYINASFVEMKLPLPRTGNKYIATQGPLPNTCNDFWKMVWEQNCGIIVMVTTLKERNRVKCHQYWPDLYQETIYEHIQVTCFSETTSQAYITRDFLVINEQTTEERHVVQLQYISWPDHGVPEDATDFLDFVQQLRSLRRDIGGPVAVHCSAGVGRTGVLILMETAMGFIEADEPIYPIEMVKTMRDQRVMMVQTMIQYRFICEAILKAYKDHYQTDEKEDD